MNCEFVVERDASELWDFPESHRIKQNLNQKKSLTFVVHEGGTLWF